MALPSPEQAQALLNSGQISPDTYQKLIGDPANDLQDPDVVAKLGFPGAGGGAPSPPLEPQNVPLSAAGTAPPQAPPPGSPGNPMRVTDEDLAREGIARSTPKPPDQQPPGAPPPAPPQMPGPPPPVSGPPTAAPGPPQNITAPAPKVSPPSKAQATPDASRDQVANGMGLPRAPAAGLPSGLEAAIKDPRVRAMYSQRLKELQPVMEAQDEVTAARHEEVQQQVDKELKLADNADELAAATKVLSAQAQKDDDDYRAASAQHIQKIQAAADDAANTKINANRYWESKSTANQIGTALAVAFGAVGSAMSHTPNAALDIINGAIARDIDAQRANLDNKHANVANQRGILADLTKVYGDHRLATADAFRRSYQQAINQGDAIAARSKSHETQLAWNTESAKLNAEKSKYEDELLQGLKARQAQMDAAAAAQQAARAKEQREFFMQRFGKTLDASLEELKKAADDQRAPADWAVQTANAAGKLGIPMPSGDTSAPQGTTQRPPGMSKEQWGAIQKERYETQTATDEFNKHVDSTLKNPVVTGAGLGTALGSHLPQRIAPESNAAQQELNTINTQMLQAIGKVAKDADGKPNKVMIEKLEQRFELHLTDTPEMRKQKLEGVRQAFNALAAEQGAKVPGADGKPSNDNADPYGKYKVK